MPADLSFGTAVLCARPALARNPMPIIRPAGCASELPGPGCEVNDCTPSAPSAPIVSPRRQQTLQWSASARRAPQVVLRFEKPPAFLSHRLVQLRLDRWQRKASRRIRDHRGWTPRRPALRRTPPNHHAGASSQRVSRCTPDGQRAPMAAWARRAPWPACRYEAQLLGRGAP